MEFVDKEDDVARFADLRHGIFQPLLKFAAVLRARQHAGEVQRDHALAAQYLRDAAFDDELRQPFDDGGLAYARLADEYGVVLRAPGEDLHDALDLPRAADDRIQLASLRRLGQVAGKLVERGRFLFLHGGVGGVLLAAAEGAQKFLAGLAQIHAHLDHHMCGHALALAHQRQQDVFGADVVLLEFAGFAHALFEYLLGARGVDHRPDRRIIVAAAEYLNDLLPRGVERDALEYHAGRAGIAEYAEEQMLRADVSPAQLRRLALRRQQRALAALGKFRKVCHAFPPSC